MQKQSKDLQIIFGIMEPLRKVLIWVTTINSNSLKQRQRGFMRSNSHTSVRRLKQQVVTSYRSTNTFNKINWQFSTTIFKLSMIFIPGIMLSKYIFLSWSSIIRSVSLTNMRLDETYFPRIQFLVLLIRQNYWLHPSYFCSPWRVTLCWGYLVEQLLASSLMKL